MIEYVTMGQVESIIENYYKEHHSELSFYATLVYLKQHGETSLQVSSIPDFSKWNLNDLPGLLDLFARIPIPVMVNEDNDVVENIQRNYYGKTTNIFKQPHYMQTLDHPEHERQPSNSVRIIYVLKGSCHTTIGKWSDTLEAESVILLSSDMNIYLETERDDIVLNVFLDKSNFTKSFFSTMRTDDIMIEFFEHAIYEAKDGIMQFKILHPEHVHSIFQHLMIEMCNRDNHSESIIRNYVQILCTELNRASMIYSASIAEKKSDASNRLVQVFPAILQYLRIHYNTISLDSLAEHFHYDSAYLSKMIKKMTGSNFTSILTQIRLDTAENLLLTTNKKPSAIAFEIGYDSYDHFVRLFKKRTGFTPNEFRKNKII